MSDSENDPFTLMDASTRHIIDKKFKEYDKKIQALLEENKNIKKRNDKLDEMNSLLLKEVIDDKNRFIKILEQRREY